MERCALGKVDLGKIFRLRPTCAAASRTLAAQHRCAVEAAQSHGAHEYHACGTRDGLNGASAWEEGPRQV